MFSCQLSIEFPARRLNEVKAQPAEWKKQNELKFNNYVQQSVSAGHSPLFRLQLSEWAQSVPVGALANNNKKLNTACKQLFAGNAIVLW